MTRSKNRSKPRQRVDQPPPLTVLGNERRFPDMARTTIDYYRVEAEFLSLGGGDVWDRVESSAWEMVQRVKRRNAEKQTALRSTLFGRRAHAKYERTRRVRNKAIVRKVRCCRVCRTMYSLTAAQVADGRGNFCTRTCAAKWSRANSDSGRPARMVAIGGRSRPLPEWAKQFGISVGMVYKRIRDGMSPAEALTKRKAGCR